MKATLPQPQGIAGILYDLSWHHLHGWVEAVTKDEFLSLVSTTGFEQACAEAEKLLRAYETNVGRGFPGLGPQIVHNTARRRVHWEVKPEAVYVRVERPASTAVTFTLLPASSGGTEVTDVQVNETCNKDHLEVAAEIVSELCPLPQLIKVFQAANSAVLAEMIEHSNNQIQSPMARLWGPETRVQKILFRSMCKAVLARRQTS